MRRLVAGGKAKRPGLANLLIGALIGRMIELLNTSDVVRLSYLRAILRDAGVETVVLDSGAGSLWGSAIGQRLMVLEADLDLAKRLVAAVEES